jgi:hypothetical protein
MRLPAIARPESVGGEGRNWLRTLGRIRMNTAVNLGIN